MVVRVTDVLSNRVLTNQIPSTILFIMNKLNKYIVPVQLIVYGESETDAVEYVEAAIDHSYLLDQDGIVGVNAEVDVDEVELYED